MSEITDRGEASVQVMVGKTSLIVRTSASVSFSQLFSVAAKMYAERSRIAINASMLDFGSITNLLLNAVTI